MNTDQMFRVDGKVALVAGGAGGLGTAIAAGLGAAGAGVIVADVIEDRAAEVVEAIKDSGAKAEALVMDITDVDHIETGIASVLERYQGIDILVNTAGTTQRAKSEEFPEELWDRILSINLKGLFFTCRAVGREMIKRGQGGRIINLASVAGLVGIGETVAYSASKGGVVQVTRTLAVEWAPHNILVNAIAPSWFETPMGSMIWDAKKLYATQKDDPDVGKLLKRTIEKVPLNRMGKPEEIVGATLFLASDAGAMVTGHVLSVDGGYVAV